MLVGFMVLVLPRETVQAQGKRAPRSLEAHVGTPTIVHATLAFAESFEPQVGSTGPRGVAPQLTSLGGGGPSLPAATPAVTTSPVVTMCTPHWREGAHGALD